MFVQDAYVQEKCRELFNCLNLVDKFKTAVRKGLRFLFLLIFIHLNSINDNDFIHHNHCRLQDRDFL